MCIYVNNNIYFSSEENVKRKGRNAFHFFIAQSTEIGRGISAANNRSPMEKIDNFCNLLQGGKQN